ncbi:MAG TPA: flagellar hook assembly protein FlgD [Longimicrobiaceae bacterium]
MINGVTTAASGVGATAAATAVSKPNGAMGKEEFLKLFVAQMKNQDPLNPMEGQELAAQLAQFSSVEQLINLNQQLEAQADASASMIRALQNGSAANLIGREVYADGDALVVSEGGAGSVTVDVANSGGTGVLRIFDLSGKEVGSRELGSVPGGRRTIELGSAAEGLAPGGYTYKVELVDADGTAVPVQTYSHGTVDGIRYHADGPYLTSGPMLIPLGSVVEVVQGQ